MSPKVLSILNNAKTFLSDDELRDLAFAIEKDLGKKTTKSKSKKSSALDHWTLESVTEDLLATHFRKKSRS